MTMVSSKEQQLLEENRKLKLLLDQQKLTIENQRLSLTQKENQLTNKEIKIANQEELIRYLQKKLYGRSKESLVDKNQLSLFEIDLTELIDEAIEDPEEEIAYRRKKRPKGRKKAVLSNFAEYDLHYTLEDKERACPCCDHEMVEVGQKTIRQQLHYIPAEIYCENVIQHSYKCVECSKKSDKDFIINSDVPKPVINGSYATASLIAHTIQMKYELKIPAYRQEGEWEKMGLPVSRQTIINWQGKSSEYYFEPLYQVLAKELINQPIIHMDETSYKVIEHEKEKTYYWLACSSRESDHQIYLYHHSSGRGFNDLPEGFEHYKGFVHCDMWPVYSHIEGAEIAGCWAHLRRYFHDALPPKNYKGQSISAWAVKQCDIFFKLEKKWKDLSSADRFKKRQKILKDKINKFFDRLREEIPSAGGKLAKAINYALKHEKYFKTFLDNGALEMSNNRAERGIKTLVIGRKNWLFSTSFKGAHHSGITLSLLETAKANGLDAEKYLTFLLKALPNEENLCEETLKDYLPWHPAIQEICQKKSKSELLHQS